MIPLNEEKAIIGALIYDSASFSEIDGLLTENDFTQQSHKLLFRAIVYLAKSSKAIEALTVIDYFQSQGLLGKVIYESDIYELVNEFKSERCAVENIKHYAKVIKERSIRKKLVRK